MSGTVVDDFQMVEGQSSAYQHVVESRGQLYGVATAVDAAGARHLLIRQATPQQQPDGTSSLTFTTVSDSNLPGDLSGSNGMKDVAVDPRNGDLYFAVTRDYRWNVMRWSPAEPSTPPVVIDQFAGDNGATSSARGIAVDAQGNVFAVGEVYKATTVATRRGTTTVSHPHWTVRRLPAGSTTWQTCDDYWSSSSNYWNAEDVVVAPSGVYVVGRSGAGSGDSKWVTRRGDATGSGFVTVDTFQADPNYPLSQAYEAGVDSNGNVYALGYGKITTKWDGKKPVESALHGIVRRLPSGGGTWATVDTFRSEGARVSGLPSVDVKRFAADAHGNVYVGGTVYGIDNVEHAFVRGSAGGTTWTAIDDWQPSPGVTAGMFGMMVDSSGTLYTAMHAYNNTTGKARGVIRRIDSPFSTTPVTGLSAAEEEQQDGTTAVVELVAI